MRKFWLVQRLEDAPDRHYDNPFAGDTNVGRTLDAQFRLDYMGSAEFEGGEVARSGNRIHRVARDLKVVTQTLTTPELEEPVHFVCTDEQEAELLPEWHEWTKNPHSLEPTYYFDTRDRYPYAPHPSERSWGLEEGEGPKYIGWWAINEDLIWTRDETRAEGIRAAFVTLAEATAAAEAEAPK